MYATHLAIIEVILSKVVCEYENKIIVKSSSFVYEPRYQIQFLSSIGAFPRESAQLIGNHAEFFFFGGGDFLLGVVPRVEIFVEREISGW